MVSLASREQATQDELEDIILSARYGELDEIQQFVEKFGREPIAEAVDERGNGCLHMAAANGHNDVLTFLLPLMPGEKLAAVNNAGNTPLHWAALNGHLDTLRLLVPALPKSALFLQNQFGRTPLSEAEANAPTPASTKTEGEGGSEKEAQADGEGEKEGQEIPLSRQQECAGYLLTFMELENMKGQGKDDEDAPIAQGRGGDAEKPSSAPTQHGDAGVTAGMADLGVANKQD